MYYKNNYKRSYTKQYYPSPRPMSGKDRDFIFNIECKNAWRDCLNIKSIADKISYSMGKKQEDGWDKKCIFKAGSLEEVTRLLDEECCGNEEVIHYNIYRWFLFRTSKIDKTLMGLVGFKFRFNESTHSHQLLLHGRQYDVHYTKTPMNLFTDGKVKLETLKELAEKLYSEQSKFSRYSTGDKFFVVYQSDDKSFPVNRLRMEFEMKFEMYKRLLKEPSKIYQIKTKHGSFCSFLVVHRKENGEIEGIVPGIDGEEGLI